MDFCRRGEGRLPTGPARSCQCCGKASPPTSFLASCSHPPAPHPNPLNNLACACVAAHGLPQPMFPCLLTVPGN